MHSHNTIGMHLPPTGGTLPPNRVKGNLQEERKNGIESLRAGNLEERGIVCSARIEAVKQ